MTMTNPLNNWEEVLAQEVKAMKKRPLPRKTARLKTFISTLLQAQREKDANVVENLQKRIGASYPFDLQFDVSTRLTIQSELDGIREIILNQPNNNEENS